MSLIQVCDDCFAKKYSIVPFDRLSSWRAVVQVARSCASLRLLSFRRYHYTSADFLRLNNNYYLSHVLKTVRLIKRRDKIKRLINIVLPFIRSLSERILAF